MTGMRSKAAGEAGSLPRTATRQVNYAGECATEAHPASTTLLHKRLVGGDQLFRAGADPVGAADLLQGCARQSQFPCGVGPLATGSPQMEASL